MVPKRPDVGLSVLKIVSAKSVPTFDGFSSAKTSMLSVALTRPSSTLLLAASESLPEPEVAAFDDAIAEVPDVGGGGGGGDFEEDDEQWTFMCLRSDDGCV